MIQTLSMYAKDFHAQWTIVLALCMFFFCKEWVRPRFGLPASLLLAACAYSSIYVWAWKDGRYFDVVFYDQQALKLFACDSLAKIMIILVPMMLLAEKRQTLLLLGQVVGSLFVIANCVAVLWQARNGCGVNQCGGIIGNPSISMGLTVAMLPIFFHSWRFQWFPLVLVAGAVLISKSSIALGLLGLLIAIKLFLSLGGMRGILASCVCGIGGVLLGGHFLLGKELLNDSDRFQLWKYMFYRWSIPANLPLGTGLGTYHVLSSHLQHMETTYPGFRENSWWLTLHNDWFQMLFECGVVGLVLLLLTYLSALFKTWREGEAGVAISILLYGVYMLLDPALHNPLPVLFGAWLFTYALKQEPFKEYV